MQYKSYQHIEKLGRDEVEGILNGKCYIQPKIDGTNSVLYLVMTVSFMPEAEREI